MWIAITLLGLGVLFAAAAVWKKKLLLWISCALTAVIAVGTVVCFTPPAAKPAEPDYAVLLGAGLRDGQATEELVRRMDLALDWLDSTEDTVLMVTGGDPSGQGVTEAQVMIDYLEAGGADMTRVLPEDRANDTRENLRNCMEIARKRGLEDDTILILTSDYHQTRAGFLARQNGQESVALSCRTPFVPRLNASLREVYAFVKVLIQSFC